MIKYNTIKQPEGSKLCGASCAAMICGYDFETLYDVLSKNYTKYNKCSLTEQCEMEAPYLSRLTEIAEFLAHHEIMMGISAVVIDGHQGKRLSLSGVDEIVVPIGIYTSPALVGVDSENYEGRLHWVFWDGGYIRDPNPKKPDTRPLSDFDGRIYDWYPITRLE